MNEKSQKKDTGGAIFFLKERRTPPCVGFIVTSATTLLAQRKGSPLQRHLCACAVWRLEAAVYRLHGENGGNGVNMGSSGVRNYCKKS